MENAGKSLVTSSCKEEKDAKAKKPMMRSERNKTKEEEAKVLSDLSVFQNLAAMLEAESFSKKKKRRRKRRKENVEVGAQEDGPVVRTKEEEAKMISDLSVFQNLATMLEAEIFRKKKKRRRKRKKEIVESGAQEDAAEEEQVDSAKEVESNNLFVSENVVPQKPSDSSFTVEERVLHRAKKGCKKNEVTISLDEFEVLSNLSNFKNLAAMMEAEASMRHKKIKRRKKKKKIGFEAQDERTVDVELGQEESDTVENVTTTKALETGSVSVSESITTEKLFVEEVKAGTQLDTVKAVDIKRALEAQSDSVTKDIVAEKLFVS